ncbi:MAG: VPDSG-CTERM sorting domain-containing protein [Opitutaceae bacterium]
MNTKNGLAVLKTVSVLFLATVAAQAAPFSITIGDNDGYGFGVADNGPAVWSPSPGYDGRSAGEIAATNGAQITDVYSAIFPGAGPSGTSTATVTFALPGIVTSATLTIDMGDFQATTFGQISVSFNGVAQPNFFNFEDGFQHTAVRSWALSAGAIANANGAGSFLIQLDRNGSGDYIAFDYFKLEGQVTGNVPDTGSTVALLAAALGAIAFIRRKIR